VAKADVDNGDCYVIATSIDNNSCGIIGLELVSGKGVGGVEAITILVECSNLFRNPIGTHFWLMTPLIPDRQ